MLPKLKGLGEIRGTNQELTYITSNKPMKESHHIWWLDKNLSCTKWTPISKENSKAKFERII